MSERRCQGCPQRLRALQAACGAAAFAGGSRCGTICTDPVRPPARRSPCSMPAQHRPSTCRAPPHGALLADVARVALEPDPDACLRPTRTRGSRCLRPLRRSLRSWPCSEECALQQGHRGRLVGHLELFGLFCALDLRPRGRRRGPRGAPTVRGGGRPPLGSVGARRAARLLTADASTYFVPDAERPGRTHAMCRFDMLRSWG